MTVRYAVSSGEARVLVDAYSRGEAQRLFYAWADREKHTVGLPLIVQSHLLNPDDIKNLEVIS